MCRDNFDYLDYSDHSEYYNRVLLKEQPFYYNGISPADAKLEQEYLNNHLNEFYDGNYKPLWKQNLFY